MACAERSELVVLSHELLHLLDGRGVEHVARAVADVARPVRERRRGRGSRGRRTRGGTRECDTTGQARRRIQRGSPIHVWPHRRWRQENRVTAACNENASLCSRPPPSARGESENAEDNARFPFSERACHTRRSPVISTMPRLPNERCS